MTRLLDALERARPTGVGLALTLSMLLVAPAFAGAGPTRLFDPFISDRTVATTSAVTFKVSYRNREGSPADWVRVRIGNTTHAMTRPWRGALPVGTQRVVFEGLSRDRFRAVLAAGSIEVTVARAPKPTPTATPKPTPGSTATPRPTMASGATAEPRSSFVPTPESVAGSGAAPIPSPSPRLTDNPTARRLWPWPDAAAGGTLPNPSPPSNGSVGLGIDPATSSFDGGPGAAGGEVTGHTPAAGGGQQTAALVASISAVALGRSATIPLGLALTVATTSVVVGQRWHSALFGKRRRDGEPPAPDDVLAGHAARGMTSSSRTSRPHRSLGPPGLRPRAPRSRANSRCLAGGGHPC